MFQAQTVQFLAALERINAPVQIVADLCNISANYDGPRYLAFSPNSWGRKADRTSSGQGGGFGLGVGVSYGFTYTTNRDGSPFVRFASGIENPFKHEFRDRFRKDVAETIHSLSISLPSGCRIWPDTKFCQWESKSVPVLGK